MNQRKPCAALVVAILSTLLFFYGFYLGGLQLIVADISASFGMSLSGIGVLAAVLHITPILLPVIFGRMADRFSKKRMLTAFAAIFGLGCFFEACSPSLSIYLLGSLLVGAGYSVCESVSSAVLADLDAEKGAAYINISQGVLSGGAVIGPIALQAMLRATGSDWRLLFQICSAGYFVMALLLCFVTFPPQTPAKLQKAAARPRYLASSLFLCLLVSIFLYCGLENGISYFVQSLFDRELHSATLAPFAISAYWTGMTLSRLICGLKERPAYPLLIGFFGLSAAALTGLGLSQEPLLSTALCALIGFGYGPIWTTLVAEAALLFPNASAGATGLMSAGCGLGGLVYPLLMGAAADRFRVHTAFFLLAATAALGLLLCVAAAKKKAKRA